MPPLGRCVTKILLPLPFVKAPARPLDCGFQGTGCEIPFSFYRGIIEDSVAAPSPNLAMNEMRRLLAQGKNVATIGESASPELSKASAGP